MVRGEKLLEAYREEGKRHHEEIMETLRLNERILKTTENGIKSAISQANDGITKIVGTIVNEHKETRNMIKNRYSVFGMSMVILTALMIGLFVGSMVSLDVCGIIVAVLAVFLSIVFGLLMYKKALQKYDENKKSQVLKETD